MDKEAKIKETLDLWESGDISTKATGVMLESLVNQSIEEVLTLKEISCLENQEMKYKDIWSKSFKRLVLPYS